jgi:iron complex outermembrane recepter protein
VPTDSTIYQLGATYKFNSTWSVYTGFNTGFDIESTAGSRTQNGKPLDPEKSQQTEIGLRFKQSNFSGSVSLFRIERVNVATADPIDPDFMINAGEQKADGIELEAEWDLNSQIQLLLGYAYIDGEITRSNDGDQGSRIGDLPEHNAKLDIRYQLNDNWNIRAGWSSISDRLLANASNYELDSYQLVNASIGYQQSDWSANLFLNNLLDEEYYSASGNRFVVIPGDPRSVSFRLNKSW